MEFSLSGDQVRLRDEITAFAKKELTPGAADRDREEMFSRDLWLRCASHKLTGLMVPEEYGGRGLDALSATIALDALGYGCADGGLAFS
ncbi:MAG TPA: acyl-CoA dehydrogenase family protein, partial [Gemmatimonadaceae bacterium]|nr:acyl-CoA dehydrogenase family protein [Gemmatimonadaceae bacterium]